MCESVRNLIFGPKAPNTPSAPGPHHPPPPPPPDPLDPPLATLRDGFTAKVTQFKSLFGADPTMLAYGQFHVSSTIYQKMRDIVEADLRRVPNDEMLAIWREMTGIRSGYTSNNLIN